MHILCTICSDLVNPAENIYVTKCGHVFHYHCLIQWIERSRTCPQCRHKVTDKCMFRFYPTVSNESSNEDAATLQSRLDDAHLQLRQHKTVVKEKDDKINGITADLKKNDDLIKSYEKRLISFESKVLALREQLEYATIQAKETQKYKQENEELKKTMQTLNDLQKVLNATSADVEQMLQGYSDVRTIATFATALKRALCESEQKKNNTRDRLHKATQKLTLDKKTIAELQNKVIQLEDDLHQAGCRYEKLQKEKDILENQLKSKVNKVPFSPEKQKEHIFIEVVPEIKQSVKPAQTPPSALNRAMIDTSSNSSFNTMVNKIEMSDSPYLDLKQSSIFSLAALQRRPLIQDKKKPLDADTLRNNAKRLGSDKHSIFHKKQPLRIESFDENKSNDVSFDGLGGHSKLDTFPVPKVSPAKTRIPKLTSKHKLKRPSPTGCYDIEQMLKKRKSGESLF